MPDWSYRTVFRPILFQLPPKLARDLALGCMGTLARMPWGPNIIDFMGHMRPDNRLACRLGDRTFPTRIGLAACVDPQLRAARAFAQFGIAFSEIGPITINGESEGPIHRDDVRETLRFEFPPASPSLATVLDELERTGHVPAYVRLILPSGPEGDTPDLQTIIVKLGERPAGYIMQSGKLADAAQSIGRTVELAREHGVGVMLVAVSADACEADIVTVKALAQSGMIQGVFVDGSVVDTAQSRTVGKPASLLTPQAVRIWREQLPCGALIIAEGGVHEPLQALELVRAGCDLICVSSGLIFTGPGLIKRINEALLFELPESTDIRPSPEELSWFWTCLIAVGMLLGGTMALIIATTRVVMPYDEATVGLTRSEICAINPQLLNFMAHDRVTLAGTMLAIGILYLALSVNGSRSGMHWARRTILVSASTGFVSFFLFLGFGYFDPFHAFVTAVLFQLLVMAIHCGLPLYTNSIAPELTNDRAWLWSQWGQLLFVIHGAVLMIGGCVIAAVGISTVFVAEDLAFMQTTAEQLFGAHPRLVPLIAHDRATFGGMLIAIGVCVLLSALWGFRRGHAWLWWALILAGCAAYGATILIHWQIGYLSPAHLFPAYAGLAFLMLAGWLSRGHLCGGFTRNANRP